MSTKYDFYRKWITLAVVLALALAACSPATTPTTSPTSAPAATSALATTSAPAATEPPPAATGPEPGRTYTIGYSQIVDHPALNEVRRGFLDGLKAAGFVEGENLVFDYQNAQGDVANARNIAEKFVADKVDLIAPCTTPNSQAAVQVAKDSGIPVVFGCVTDPVAAGILASVDKPSGSNVTGVYGPLPIPELFDLFLQIDPNMKKVGTIYNASEDNSVLINKQSKAEAEKRGLQWIEVTVASSADVKTAAESLIGKIDAYITGQDNTVASAFEAVVKTAVDNGLPIFTMDPTAVGRGAVASLATNQYDIGVLWAKELAVPVLLGTDPGTLTPIKPKSYDVQVNLSAAAGVGLTVPAEVVSKAANVYGDTPEAGRVYKVGFTQIVDHPALNATRQGFLDGLKAAGFVEGKNLVFDYQNAQGDVGNARNIAEKFVADKVDLMAPCTTPTVQAAVQVAKGSTVPVVFGCVDNPVGDGILESVDKPSGTNVTGLYGPIPVPQLFDLFLKIDPNMKKVGTIYNPSETNSVNTVAESKAEAEKRGLQWVEVTVTSSAEMKTAAESLVGKIDAYILVQDNTVASAFEAVVQVAQANQLPIFSMDPTAVERGAVASLAGNQYDKGMQWATELAVPVLLGGNPGSLTPVKFSKSFDLQVNLDAAKAANLTVPPDIIATATQVFGQP